MIRLKIYQETAHFRIPTIGNPYLSFPLPPPSSVYGFLRNLTDFESINYLNTQLSIQGCYKSSSFEVERLILERENSKKKKASKDTNIIPIQKLHECTWIIHIKSPFEDKIVSSIRKSPKIFRLGRQEDLIIDIDIETNLQEKPIEETLMSEYLDESMNIYLKWDKTKNQTGSLFSMALDTIVNSKKEIVGYKQISLVYMKANRAKEHIKIFDGKYLVSWLPNKQSDV